MIIVIDYNLKELNICVFKQKRKELFVSNFIKNVDELKGDEVFKKYIRAISGKEKIEAISFRILFGGDYFDKPVLINPEFFKQFEKLTDFFPFYVPATSRLLKRFKNIFNDTPLMAFFETSFFLGLPDEEKYYALPFEYHKNNKIKKWGFHGIFHSANAKTFSPNDKIISIVFDKQTTVCAIHKKRPFSISLGYTPLEGVMSRASCGDLDPGIVFYLMNTHGFSIYKIDEMLKNKSGFLGLTDYDIELSDMLKLRAKDAKVKLAFDVYISQIMKHIGEGISVLGGLSNIVFCGSNADKFSPIIFDILKKVYFLGINTARLPWEKCSEINNISSKDSKIKVYINRIPLAKIIFQESRAF